MPFCGMHLLDCLTSRLCATHIRLFSLSLHSRNSAVLFRFHHRAHPSNILPAKITRSVHLVCFASLEPRTEQAKKKRRKIGVCALVAGERPQARNAVDSCIQLYKHRHSSLVCCNMQPNADTHTIAIKKCSASVIASALPSRYLQSYINTFIPS